MVHSSQAERPDDDIALPDPQLADRSSMPIALARLAFGPDHWTVTNDQPFAYYNAERGFWMYCARVEEIQEENGVRYDGKRLQMKPFAMIWKSSDGKNIQMLTAE